MPQNNKNNHMYNLGDLTSRKIEVDKWHSGIFEGLMNDPTSHQDKLPETCDKDLETFCGTSTTGNEGNSINQIGALGRIAALNCLVGGLLKSPNKSESIKFNVAANVTQAKRVLYCLGYTNTDSGIFNVSEEGRLDEAHTGRRGNDADFVEFFKKENKQPIYKQKGQYDEKNSRNKDPGAILSLLFHRNGKKGLCFLPASKCSFALKLHLDYFLFIYSQDIPENRHEDVKHLVKTASCRNPSELVDKILQEYPKVREKLNSHLSEQPVALEVVPEIDAKPQQDLALNAKLKSGIEAQVLDALENAVNNDARSAGKSFRYDINRGGIDIERQRNTDTAHRALEMSKIVNLFGSRHCGKKSTSYDIIAELVLCNKVDFNEENDRPIITVRASEHSYPSLCETVLKRMRVFKDHYPSNPASKDDAQIVSSSNSPLQALLDEIRELNIDLPFCFLFTDVDSISIGDIDRHLRNIGIKRLLRVLSLQDKNIIIMTSKEALKLDKDYGRVENIELIPSNIESLNKKLNGKTLPDETYQFDWFNRFVLSLDQKEKDQHRILGDHLVATAALLQLQGADQEIPSQIKISDYKKRISDLFFRNNDKKEKGKDYYLVNTQSVIDLVMRPLIQEFRERGMLEAVLLISASKDGLTTVSLKKCLEIWNHFHKKDRKNEVDVINIGRAIDELFILLHVTHSCFLRYQHPPQFDFDELDFEEIEAIQHRIEENPAEQSKEYVWRIDTPNAATIVDVLAEDDPAMSRQAFRLIAMRARNRAQNKRMFKESYSQTITISESVRDIQCYEALLSSLDPEKIQAICWFDIGPLRLCESDIFKLDATDYDFKLAFRYTVLCLLRQNIDQEHRLTMMDDEDSLRLFLYLRLFLEPGRPHNWSLEELVDKVKTKGRPRHLQKEILTNTEYWELLETIALTAYHTQQTNVIVWVHEHLDEAFVGASIHNKRKYFVRVWCSLIDAYIQRGGKPDEKALYYDFCRREFIGLTSGPDVKDSKLEGILSEVSQKHRRNHAQSLTLVNNLLYEYFSNPDLKDSVFPKNLTLDIASKIEIAGVANPRTSHSSTLQQERSDDHRIHLSVDLPHVASWLRLWSRKAELLSILDVNRLVAQSLYEAIALVEKKISPNGDPKDPVILSGRTARRYLRFLMRDPVFRDSDLRCDSTHKPKRDGLLKIAETLIEVNIGRLRRFSGAERLGVYLDKARYHFGKNELSVAHRYATLAEDCALGGHASHGSKLDIFSVLVDVKLYIIEASVFHRIDSGEIIVKKDYLTEFELEYAEIKARLDSIDALCRGKGLDFAPYHCIGKALQLRFDLIGLVLGHHPGRRNLSLERLQQDAYVIQTVMKSLQDYSFYEDTERFITLLDKLSRCDQLKTTPDKCD